MKTYLIKAINFLWKNKIIIIINIFMIIIVILTIWYGWNLLPVQSENKITYNFSIKAGESTVEISDKLQKANLIKNKNVFLLYITIHNLRSKIQSGYYLLSPSESMSNIIKKLVNGKTNQRIITVPEGSNIFQIKQIMINKGFKEDEIIKALQTKYDYNFLLSRPPNTSLEGYLFPDTYRISPSTTPQKLINLMLSNFSNKITPDIIKGFVLQNLNLYQGITLASIIEQEAPDSKNRCIIAQVFLKRLKEGNKLEADPTVFYANYLIGKGDFDIKILSPYNTYQTIGLPPGPINNPSLDSIKAVINPSNTNYSYFFADKDRTIHYASSYKEHEDNILKYGKYTYTKPNNSY